MRMPNTIDNKMIATCGMNCKACYKHLSVGKYTKICNGCKFQDETRPNSCRNCKIYECEKTKDINYCYECDLFPCLLIKNLNKSYVKRYNVSLIENGTYMAKYSIKKFLENEKIKWECKCGGIISLHDKICSECKKEYN